MLTESPLPSIVSRLRPCLAALLLSLVLSVCWHGSSAVAEETSAARCEEFVERLVEDDYRLFFSLEWVPDHYAKYPCADAHENDPDNPVFMVGLARSLDLGSRFKRREAAIAAELLREAAEQNYEPALLQLLRYRWQGWQDSMAEDAFLNRIRSIGFKIEDDPRRYISQLRSTQSGAARDLVLGTIVFGHLQIRELRQDVDRAKVFAYAGMARRSPAALYYVGMMYVIGFGFERDKAKGFELIREAASLGNLEAQVMYAHGGGPYSAPPQDRAERLVEMYKYLTLAVNKKHKYAFGILGNRLNYLHADESQEYGVKNLEHVLLDTVSCNINDGAAQTLEFFLAPDAVHGGKLPPCRNLRIERVK